MRGKFDRFGHTVYGQLLLSPSDGFRKLVFQEAEKFDIIHLHELDVFLRSFERRRISKPVIMHYHGSDIRGGWRGKRKNWKLAARVIVSTKALLNGAPEGVTYLPNPVDTDLFYPNPNPREVSPNSALTFKHGAVDLAEELAEKYGLELSVHRRNKTFLEMPSLFRQFSWYIDVKRNGAGVLLCRKGGSGSLTGLEASACGLKVINSDGEIRDGLPSEHRAENAVKALYPIYREIMELS